MVPAFTLALPILLLASPAWAHPVPLGVAGLSEGILHPIMGLDHLLAMVAVGLLAATGGGRAMWVLPSSFLSAMIVGGMLAWTGQAPQDVEPAIAVSVVVLGALALLRVRAPLPLAALLVGAFGAVHGYAHGAEMPEHASRLAYVAGFVASTALLHAIGLGVGLLLNYHHRARLAWGDDGLRDS